MCYPKRERKYQKTREFHSQHKEKYIVDIMELEYQWLKKLWWTVGLIVISSVIVLVEKVFLKPRRIRTILEKQGIKGPKPSFPFGNVTEMQQIRPQPSASADSTEDWVNSLFPYFQTWKQQYGISNFHSSTLFIF